MMKLSTTILITTTMIGIVFACLAAVPATQPALDTPQGVQVAYRMALNAQDAKAALDLFHIRTPGERATAEVLVANDLAAARLAASAEKTFAIPLLGGGTLLPPAETEAWQVEGGLATLAGRKGARPMSPPLRQEGGRYKIDLVAWGMNWMDGADGDAARDRHAHGKAELDEARRRVDEGFYRTLGEVNDNVYNSEGFLSPRPGQPVAPKPPRGFRRPVKVDASSPMAAYRSAVLAEAEGDGAAWLRCHVIVDPADEPKLKAYSRYITGSADLEEAAVAKFGAAGANVGLPVPLPRPRASALKQWNALAESEAELVVKGDEAFWGGIEEPASEAVRMNGQWKLRSRPKAMIGNKEEAHEAEEGTDWTKLFNMVADLQASFTRQTTGGSYATVEELNAAMIKAATNPTTSPL